MTLRAALSIGLAIAFPVASFFVIRNAALDPVWLSIPDVLISVGLLLGLRQEQGYGFCLTLFITVLALALYKPELSALFPGIVLFLISRYFSRTLKKPGQTPLITEMATRVRGPELPMSNEAVAYTTALTRVWSVLLVLLALNQLFAVLMTKSTWPWIMGNTFAPAFIFLFIVLEPLYRRYRLPNEPRHSFRHFFSRLVENDWKGKN